jgi:hypothetical protein
VAWRIPPPCSGKSPPPGSLLRLSISPHGIRSVNSTRFSTKFLAKLIPDAETPPNSWGVICGGQTDATVLFGQIAFINGEFVEAVQPAD